MAFKRAFSIGLLLLAMHAIAQASDSLISAVIDGEVSLGFRYRFEFVDQDGFDRNAEASTLRSRLNFETQQWHGLKFFIEVDNIAELIADNFNSGSGSSSPERNIFPVVADVNGTEVNQVWLNYAIAPRLNARLGRQRISLDNERFIGGVGWRQNEQTYDGVSVQINSWGQSELFLSYVYNVNRIFGDQVPAGDHDQNTVLANFSAPIFDELELSSYYYGIDNNDVASFSTRTVGLHLAGEHTLVKWPVNWGAQWANQVDNSNNPIDYNANYWRLDGSIEFMPLTIKAGLEILEGDQFNAGAAFRTPLATLHAFNGFADAFLTTPDDGLEDIFIGTAGKLGAYNWAITWHDFSAESGNRDFGWELDATLNRRFGKHFSVLLKGARFDSDNTAFPDTLRLWLMLTAVF